MSVVRRIRRGLEFNFTIDNLADRLYYETQNYFVSRLPGEAPKAGIHATPDYPLTVTAGITLRMRSK